MTSTPTLATDLSSAVAALKAKLPAALQPWADTYGPVVLGWAQADLQAWLQMIVAGDIYGAYSKVLAGMGSQQAVDNWATIQQGWAKADAATASDRSGNLM